MTVRPAVAEDAARIVAIWTPVIRDTAVTFNDVLPTVESVALMIAAKAEAGHAFLVAEDAGVISGFAYYGQFRASSGYRRTGEHTIILDPAARGRGLGRALMAAIEDHARAAGFVSLWAGVSAENPAGVTFHAALGFAEIARLPDVGWKFERLMDLVLMQKRL